MALAELLPRDRTLLRQHHLLGLGIGEIGTMYGVHRATAARWIERCTRVLLNATRRTLATHLRVDRTDVDSILRLVRSKLEISIRAALAAEDAGTRSGSAAERTEEAEVDPGPGRRTCEKPRQRGSIEWCASYPTFRCIHPVDAGSITIDREFTSHL